MKIAAIGECMLELSGEGLFGPDKPSEAKLSYGGDTLNTALYLARLGSCSAFVTAMGADEASQWMVSDWERNGLDISWVSVDPERTTGAYLITTDASGERRFIYWRSESAASRFIDRDSKLEALIKKLQELDWAYFSGITLGILDDSSRSRFFKLLEALKKGGTKIAFDGNYRSKLWSNSSEARDAFRSACQLATICLPTVEDEQSLFGDADKDAVVDRLLGLGVEEVAAKLGAEGCYVATRENRCMVPGHKVKVIDTTAAGDSFNAAYLHHRMIGRSAVDSARKGNALAAEVIQYRGAMMPGEAGERPA